MNMNLFSVIGIGIVAVILATLLKQVRPEIALLISLSAGLLIFGFVLTEMRTIVTWWQEVSADYGEMNAYLSPLIKVLGVAYLTQFASQACKDAGEGAVALKLELSGKVVILGLSIPIVKMILELIRNLLS